MVSRIVEEKGVIGTLCTDEESELRYQEISEAMQNRIRSGQSGKPLKGQRNEKEE